MPTRNSKSKELQHLKQADKSTAVLINDIVGFVDRNLLSCCKGYVLFNSTGIMPEKGCFQELVTMCRGIPGVDPHAFAKSRVAEYAALFVIEHEGE